MRWAAAIAMLGACSSSTPAGDPFPVHVDLTSGPVLVHVARPGDLPVTATLDVLAPFTLIDPGPDATGVERPTSELDLYGQRTAGSAELVERARFSLDVVLLHPCDPTQASCTVGPPAAPVAIGAVLGADALGGSAIRFDFPHSDVYVLPDIAGATELRDQECDAVFPSPFHGGGTSILGGADVDFTGRRIAIGACLGGDPSQVDGGPGTNVLFVLSTGIGPTLLGASAYTRYCQTHGCALDPTTLPAQTVLLPSGPIVGHRATLTLPGSGVMPKWTNTVALVANQEASTQPSTYGPCGEVRASHCLTTDCCRTAPDNASLCTKSSCSAPATIELTRPVDVVVVPDDEPALQALRAELRPDQPEVDGLLGIDALRALRLDVDYPNGRLLARCAAGAADCAARPQLTSSNQIRPVACCAVPTSSACTGVPPAVPDPTCPDGS